MRAAAKLVTGPPLCRRCTCRLDADNLPPLLPLLPVRSKPGGATVKPDDFYVLYG